VYIYYTSFAPTGQALFYLVKLYKIWKVGIGMYEVTTEQIKKTIEEYKHFLNGKSGGFITSLYQTINKADMQNQAKLAKAYPAEVLVYKLFADGPYANIYMFYKIDGTPLEGGLFPKEIDSDKKLEIGALLFGSVEKTKQAWCLD
jgi:hypothetical protein